MPYKPITIEDLRALIHKGEVKDPLVFLESIMSGQDPRRLSSIYELICEIDSFTNGELSKDDWAEIVNHVTTRFKYHAVSMSESINAAKTIAEYMYPKRKQIDTGGSSSGALDPSQHPLTVEEIELFKEKFNDEF